MSQDAPLPPDSLPLPVEAPSSSKVSKLFNSGGDVIFRSSDNVLFYIQQKYLEANAEGFPLAEHTTKGVDEVVPLTESSNILELLFQFTYPQMPPDLAELEFPELMELAEAAEKYLIHHGRQFCLMRIGAFVTQYPLEIFAFAAEHDHMKLLYEVAPRLVGKPLSEIAYRIPSGLYIPWSLYHDQFISNLGKQAIDHTFSQPDTLSCSNNTNHTNHWRRLVAEWRAKMSNDMSLLVDLDESLHISPEYLGSCCNAFVNWRDRVKKPKRTSSLEHFVKQHRAKRSGRVF
ncbi:hypothetical protein D9758_013500 [Tetrapyrgos nigripes]|uniref:BTB domain-containing protein n=1 Tax=Tetrapyrgos nigripes TaxID=182062 RepID=A0A8H5D1E3_9AGAR|nr:hypothetical protein D9758_013500 [Tetrapyrgos nigripes]